VGTNQKNHKRLGAPIRLKMTAWCTSIPRSHRIRERVPPQGMNCRQPNLTFMNKIHLVWSSYKILFMNKIDLVWSFPKIASHTMNSTFGGPNFIRLLLQQCNHVHTELSLPWLSMRVMLLYNPSTDLESFFFQLLFLFFSNAAI